MSREVSIDNGQHDRAGHGDTEAGHDRHEGRDEQPLPHQSPIFNFPSAPTASEKSLLLHSLMGRRFCTASSITFIPFSWGSLSGDSREYRTTPPCLARPAKAPATAWSSAGLPLTSMPPRVVTNTVTYGVSAVITNFGAALPSSPRSTAADRPALRSHPPASVATSTTARISEPFANDLKESVSGLREVVSSHAAAGIDAGGGPCDAHQEGGRESKPAAGPPAGRAA